MHVIHRSGLVRNPPAAHCLIALLCCSTVIVGGGVSVGNRKDETNEVPKDNC